MFKLFEPRKALDRLREKYSFLMRRSYELAVIDKDHSELMHQKACTILKEIRRMENQNKDRSA